MNITKYLFGFGVMAAMGLASCSNDEPAVMVPENTGADAFYATVTLSLPTNGSRSATVTPGDNGNSEDGTIVGEDYENKIKSILVILATKDNNGEFVLQTVNQGDANVNGGAAAPTYTMKFNNTAITALVKANEQVYPFVICNPSADMVAKFNAYSAGNKTFANDIVSLSDPDNFNGWRDNNFLMTNSYINTPVSLPLESELKAYTTSNNPFNLTSTENGGPIKVERTVARFDFKSKPGSGSLGLNTYEIKDAATNSSATLGYVTLTDMALINLAKDFYTFRRVSDTGTSADWTIGGLETPVNYMVSPNSDDVTKREFMLNGFNGTSTIAPSSLVYTPLSTSTDYTIWRYATENAIPGYNNQKKGITTGVVFKGHITFADSSIDTDKPVYKFGSTIYGNLEALIADIKANPNTFMAAQAKDAGLYEIDNVTGDYTFVTDESKFNTAGGPQLSDKGFTVFRPDNADGNYYVYYYYWNRHNDNKDPNSMGIMEFGVVRNNVYRLAVNNISNFGHTADPNDDPDPEDPDDDDETANLYISLDVQVLPWVVRENNIEF